MKRQARTISLIGKDAQGFTFVEVMIALIVLSAGIVTIYRSFFLCVDYLNNLATRIYAVHLLDERIADVSRSLTTSTDGYYDSGGALITIPINQRQVTYQFEVSLNPIGNISGLYQLAVDLTWMDGRRDMHLSRVAYLIK